MSTASEVRERGRSAASVRDRVADAAGVVAAFALLVLSARSGGGFFPSEYLAMGVAALLVCAGIVLVRLRLPRPTRRGAVAVAALALYAGWIGASASWSSAPGAAQAEFERHVAYVAVLLLGILTIRTAHGARALATAVAVALVGIALAGLASRLLPGLGLPGRDPSLAAYRLSWPMTYWNAQGAVTAMAIVLAVGFASDRRSWLAVRLSAAFVVPALAASLLLTVSRGSLLALVVGVAVLIALARRPLQTGAVALACAVPSVVAVALLLGEPSVVDDPSLRPSIADVGPRLFATTLALGVLSAALSAVGLTMLRRLERTRRQRRGVRRNGPAWTPAVAVAGGVLLLAVLVVGATRLDGPVASRTGGVERFVREQRTAFLEAAPETEVGVERLGSAKGNRSDVYRVAWREFTSSPVVGAGAGEFPADWLRERRTPQAVLNVHSLPLEALAATGLIGLAALVAFVAALARGADRLRRRPGVLSRSAAAGVSAAVATFLVSCAIDWTWQMGTATAAALLLGATLLVDHGEAGRGAGIRRRARTRRRVHRRSSGGFGSRGTG